MNIDVRNLAGRLLGTYDVPDNETEESSALAAFAMISVSVTICTVLRSSLIGNNDLGWRGFLIAQFALLLWSADLLVEWPRVPRRSLLTVLIALGAAGTIYDLGILRFYTQLSEAGAVPLVAWLGPDRDTGRRNYAVREAYQWARANTAPDAIVQSWICAQACSSTQRPISMMEPLSSARGMNTVGGTEPRVGTCGRTPRLRQ